MNHEPHGTKFGEASGHSFEFQWYMRVSVAAYQEEDHGKARMKDGRTRKYVCPDILVPEGRQPNLSKQMKYDGASHRRRHVKNSVSFRLSSVPFRDPLIVVGLANRNTEFVVNLFATPKTCWKGWYFGDSRLHM